MLNPRVARSLDAARTAFAAPLPTISSIGPIRLALFRRPTSPTLQLVRNATHKSEGRANGPKDGAGKRLGAKKGSEEYVIPGNIIFRQRGTEWFPGENTALGRDHCIYATQPGYVKYYRDPARHPKRRYIGVTFDREDRLPYPPNAARRRRLGLVAVQMNPVAEEAEAAAAAASTVPPARSGAEPYDGGFAARKAELQKAFKHARKGYAVRQTNWDIGRAAERAGVTVRRTKKNDRFANWRRKAAEKKEKARLAVSRKVKGKRR